jgi:hypothetical protein
MRSNRTAERSHVGGPEDEVFLQPWFVSKAEYVAVRRILPPSQMLKMRYYFDDYGCLKCEKLKVLYGSNGLCRQCSIIVRARLVLALKRRFKKLGVRMPNEPFDRYLRRIFGRKSRVTSSICPRRAR